MEASDFTTLVLPHRDRIFRIAKGILCDVPAAEDATQDILEKLWLRKGALSQYGNMNAVIYTITRNHCIDHIRAQRNRYRSSADIYNQKDISANTDLAVETKNSCEIVEKLMSTLPVKQRMVMLFRDIEGYEFEEISQIMEMDETAVRMNLSRARKSIRDKLIKIMNHGTKE